MTAILGGGIGGLSAAFYALENPRLGALTLFEASDRLGGWIRTKRSPTGAIFEKGARTMRSSNEGGRNTLRMIETLDLTDQILKIPDSHPTAKNRLIYANKQLHVLPSGLMDLFRTKSPMKRPLIMSFFQELRAPKVEKEDDDLYNFVQRRLGQDVADYMISPMVCGICAGDAKKISVKFLMRSLFESEQKHGSVLKGAFKSDRMQSAIEKRKQEEKNDELLGRPRQKTSKLALTAQKEKWAAWTLENGMETLPQALADKISEDVDVQFKKCTNLTFRDKEVDVEVDGKLQKFNNIISSLPAKNLAELVKKQHPELANELEAIPSVSVALINFEYKENVLPTQAFGFLVPPNQNLPLLGVIFDSCVRSRESTVLTVMMGGAWFEHYFGTNPSEEKLLSTAIENLRSILKINQDPLHFDVSILRDCIHQQIVGHDARIKRIQEYITAHGMSLALCGSSFHGVGVNDVILSSKSAVDDTLLRDINA